MHVHVVCVNRVAAFIQSAFSPALHGSSEIHSHFEHSDTLEIATEQCLFSPPRRLHFGTTNGVTSHNNMVMCTCYSGTPLKGHP